VTFKVFRPSGKQGEAESVSIKRIKDGKIVERRVINDWTSLMQHFGIIPSPQAAK
jgi:ketosteroid isomerase-like protein